jgi:ankyrin repeat protein
MRHEAYAMNTLFNEKMIEKLLTVTDKKRTIVMNGTDDGMQRTGITIGIVNQRPIFVHRTFAEYFAANWFVKHLNHSGIKELLRKVLFESGNEIFRNFFDRILCKVNCKLQNEVLNGGKTIRENSAFGAEVHINAVDEGGRTALHLAAACGDEYVVNILLSRGADVSVRDDLFGWQPAVYADRCTNLGIAIMLLQKKEQESETLKIIEEYDKLLNNSDPTIHDISLDPWLRLNNTLLHIAVGKDDSKFVAYLLQHGFCFDVGNSGGRTAFHNAVESGSKRIVKIFVDFCSGTVDGSDLREGQMVRDLINLTDKEDYNSLLVCFSGYGKCEELCEYLIQTYVETLSIMKQQNSVAYFNELESFFNSKNKCGDTPLLIACEHRSTKCAELLVRKYTSELQAASLNMNYDQLDSFLNAQNKTGFTPLHWAVMCNKLEFVKYLTESYSDALASMRSSDSTLYQNKLLAFLNGVDNEGNTPLCLASSRWDGDASICKYLIRKNLETISPLKEEDIDAYLDGLRRLLNHGNDDGDTPIALACKNGNLKCLKVYTRELDGKSELKACSSAEYCNQIHDFFSSKNKDGLTPLHFAVQCHKCFVRSDIVKCLVEFYSDTLVSVSPADSEGNRDKLLAFLNVADKDGNTPLCLASERGDRDLCHYLISKHLSILLPLEAENVDMYRDGLQNLFFYKNSNEDTPLALACAGDQLKLACIKVWIRRYNNYCSYLKKTDENKAEVVKRYLETTNKNGMTPLTLAESSVKDWIVKFCKKLQ